ncbi:MAG: proline dehydrogenase [Myxococcales bacterium]|nr:proline dehydrogenase [Myxococcales bacterium]
MEANSYEQRERRVRRVLAVGRELACPATRLGQRARVELLRTSGLSPAGLELALGEHLETDASDAEMAAFIGRSGVAERCHVVLAANVCTAALRAVAFAFATAPRVLLRPSRRDPALARILAECLPELQLIDDLAFSATQLVASTASGASGASTASTASVASTSHGEEAHLYGSDAALDAIVAGLPRDLRVLRHGSGMGLAFIARSGGATDSGGDAESLELAAALLARDLIVFDGRGCLSPRVALVDGAPERAHAFARALDAELTRRAATVRRGTLDDDARAELSRYRATMECVGTVFARPDHLLALDDAPEAFLLPPAHRTLLVMHASDRAIDVLGPYFPLVTTVGVSTAAPSRNLREPSFAKWSDHFIARCPHARIVPLGTMQKPPFDGPVDLRGTRGASGGVA